MNRKKVRLILYILFLMAILFACAKPTEIVTMPSPTDKKVPLTPTSMPIPTNNILQISAEDNQNGKRVERIGELIGSWADGDKQIEVQVISQADLSWGTGLMRMHGTPMPGGSGWDCDVYEWFTFDRGQLIWGDTTFPCASNPWLTWGYEQNWIDNAIAHYDLFITYHGNQPDTLRFVLEPFEDNSPERKEYLTDDFFHWGEALAP